MTNINPAYSAEKLHKRVSELVNDTKDTGRLNELLWVRWMDDAEKEINGPLPDVGYMLTASLYGLKGNRESFLENYNCFMKLSPHYECGLHDNLYLMALTLGLPELGLEYINSIVDSINDDIPKLLSLAEYYAYRYQFVSANNIVNKLDKIVNIQEHGIDIGSYNFAREILTRNSVDQKDILERMSVASNLIYSKYEILKLKTIKTQFIQSAGSLRCVYYLYISNEEAFDLSWDIATAISEKFDNPLEETITFSVSPALNT